MRAQMAIHMYIYNIIYNIYIYYQQMAEEPPSEYINGEKNQTTTSRLSAQLHLISLKLLDYVLLALRFFVPHSIA
jgi:hypothetical protein